MKFTMLGVDTELTRPPSAHRTIRVDELCKAADFMPPESVFRAYPHLSRDAFQASGKYLTSSPVLPPGLQRPLRAPRSRLVRHKAESCWESLRGCWRGLRGLTKVWSSSGGGLGSLQGALWRTQVHLGRRIGPTRDRSRGITKGRRH